MRLLSWIKRNKQWFFSGIGVWLLRTALGSLIVVLGFLFVRFHSNIKAIVIQIKQITVAFWNHLISQFFMPHWLLYILLVCSCFSLILAILKFIKIVQKHKDERSYKEDVFEEAIWRWDKLTNKGIKNLRPFCPRCDTAIDFRSSFRADRLYRTTLLYCDSCKKGIKETSEGYDIKESVKRQIEGRFRTGDWRHSHIRLGKLYCQSEKHDKAIECLKKALTIAPPNAEAYWFLGEIYLDKEEYDLAIDIFREATEAISEPDKKSLFHYILATLYSETDKNALAIIEQLQKAIDFNEEILESIKTDSIFDNIREMSEFRQLIEVNSHKQLDS